MAQGEAESPREGKEVYTGTIEHLRPGGEKSMQESLPVVYRVTCRSIDKHGQALLMHEVEVRATGRISEKLLRMLSLSITTMAPVNSSTTPQRDQK